MQILCFVFFPRTSVAIQAFSIHDLRLHLFSFCVFGGLLLLIDTWLNFTPLLREKLESHKAGYDHFISLKKHFAKRWIHFITCYRQQHNPYSAQSSCNLPRAGALVISISMFFLTHSTRGIERLFAYAQWQRELNMMQLVNGHATQADRENMLTTHNLHLKILQILKTQEKWQWWNVIEYIYLSTVLKYNFEVLACFLSISISCDFILPLHYISEGNIVLCMVLHLSHNWSY